MTHIPPDPTQPSREALSAAALDRGSGQPVNVAPGDGLPMRRLPTRRGGAGTAVEHPDRFVWPRVSVVIPTLNEEQNLPTVLGELPAGIFEVIIVDGRSIDATVEVARAARPTCVILEQSGYGKGDALICGFAAARGDIIVTLDADGSANPAEIPLFVGALMAGAHFTKGSRRAVGGGSADLTAVRRLGNRMLGAVVNVLYGTRYTDLCYGYNAFWRSCLPYLAVDCRGFEVETLMNVRIAKAGLRVSEVPSFERERFNGTSNLRAVRDGWRVLRTILRERWLTGAPPIPAADDQEEDARVALYSEIRRFPPG
jgi:glycosyltransferase involved in cell wall biosynthesis